jgi:GNAT superfamily N-acetyltransferase
MKLELHPLTPDRWNDLESLFNARGCSVARGCWCMYYRVSGKGGFTRPSDEQRKAAKEALKTLSRQDPPPGLIGYQDGTPVGWISLGPREDFAKLARSPVMKPVDGERVWSIVCLVVPSAYRKQGVARALIAGSIDYAKKRGAKLLEAYPVDKDQPGAAEAPWFGSKRMYDELGFKEIARRRQDRPIMRLKLK